MVVKKKSSHAHKHVAETASVHKEHKEVKKDFASQLIPKDQNAWISAGIFVLIGLIVGALLMTGLPAAAVNDSCEIGQNVNLTNLKSTVGDYINANLIVDDTVTANITDANDLGNGLYELAFEVDQNGAVVGSGFVYSNGQKLILAQGIFDLAEPVEIPAVEEPVPVEVAKTEAPNVELFVWSYCPYGVTALTPFADVAVTLKDTANFDVVLYYDGHGAFETQQNKIQACIQETDKDKYWAYAAKFASDIYPKCSGDIACDLDESTKLMNSLGIDSNTVLNCVDTVGEALLASHSARAQELGVTGSPSLVVNGTIVTNVARTANGFLGAVCNGFIASPESCNTVLSDNAGVAAGSC
ncbi:MAG: hypothetical protein WC915_00695 [archaeon]|jgi:hypothetical protein